MPKCVEVLEPVDSLLKGNHSKMQVLTWDSKQIAAFNDAKTILCNTVLLAYPMHCREVFNDRCF